MRESSIREVLEDVARRLDKAGIESPRRNAEWMLGDVLSKPRALLYADTSERITVDDLAAVEAMVRRRLKREPLQYILGYTEFFGLRIDVTPSVLIPRPETEELVEVALASLDSTVHPRALDVGTGSGCIALAIKNERPDSSVYACDVSPDALAVARKNAQDTGLGVEWIEADILSVNAASDLPDELDLLISNPPYVAEEEVQELPAEVAMFEPHLALFARGDPLVFYRRLVRLGREILKNGAWIVLEVHANHAGSVEKLLLGAEYDNVEIRRDLANRERLVRAMR